MWTFKPDLAVFVNLDMLITNLLSFFPVVALLSNLNPNTIQPVTPVPLNQSINSNFEADVLEWGQRRKKGKQISD